MHYRLTEEEKEKLLQKKKSDEEKLRKTGELQSMASLLTKLPEVKQIFLITEQLLLIRTIF